MIRSELYTVHSSFTHSFKRGERREWDEPRDSLSGVYLKERRRGRETEKGM